MVDGVVVVPQEAGGLAVGVVIILELAGRSDVLCPAIPGGTL